jgi:hypothetical protein
MALVKAVVEVAPNASDKGGTFALQAVGLDVPA